MKYPITNDSIVDVAMRYGDKRSPQRNSQFWSHFLTCGTSLWIDSGDIGAAQALWCDEFSALTTNNTLLNNEVQKGTYDHVIPLLAKEVNTLTKDEQVKEIAFAINAIHGLRLVSNFNCKVSVELHTDLANDIEDTIYWGQRLYSICPNHFIIKVPFTSAGLIAARKLHEQGVPVNMTLGFSVRQNAFAAIIAKPSYTNVFLGRIGAYFKNNNLSNGTTIGEKVLLETQHCMRTINKNAYSNTKLIAASIRSSSQLLDIIGTDTFTIPTKVISEAITNRVQPHKSCIKSIPELNLPDELIRRFNLKHLWQVKDHEKETLFHIEKKLPQTISELEEYANDNGCHDMFPTLSKDEYEQLNTDGKIPIHLKWENKISSYQIGIDTLLNRAGLLAFKKDQIRLDKRIEEKI